ncbi:ammonium transporter [Treponema sp.]|uniref:ammonium transporter n=1 Tax=Treponema sp. TaxID=166 RepID=UPI0025E9DB4C|nr:ammonium transporter [Treponema sp.]MCR5217558.1 ammonium transporter [Treponema sp.]
MSTTFLFNSVWVLCASVFVFLMQAGFACMESGFSRPKNACNIWLKNLCDFCVGGLVYYFVGFGLMYGEDWHGIIGINGFINPLSQDLEIWKTNSELSPEIFLLYQTMFCATTATIISGSVAERFKFDSYLIVSAVMTGFIYPVIGHWIWGGGWLSSIGVTDFAGSLAVHTVGAVAAFMGALLVGPRIGKYTADGKSNAIPGHSVPMGILGALILWFGWYGFNPGSELALDETTFYTTIPTTLTGCAGGIAGLFVSWIRYGKPDPTLAANGALAALVGICTVVAEVTPLGSVIMGLILGALICFTIPFVDQKLHVDDPVGAISLHGGSGITGALLAGLFSSSKGLLYGHGASYLGSMAIGVIAVVGFAGITTFITFYILKKTLGIRIPEKVELNGLDIEEHGMLAYPYYNMR